MNLKKKSKGVEMGISLGACIAENMIDLITSLWYDSGIKGASCIV